MSQPLTSISSLYSKLILLYFQNCNSIRGNTYDINLTRLITFKKRYIREIISECNAMQLVYLFSPYEYYILLFSGPVVFVSYGPAPLMGLLGLNTKRIIVPMIMKGMNHMAYLTPCSDRCMVCATVCLTVAPSFSDITNVSTISHSFKTDRSRTPYFTSPSAETIL